jgi:hypothetical protein
MKPVLVAILKGGLGNQLFGYAAARAIARRGGRELLLDDTSGFLRDGYRRRYRLARFRLRAGIAPDALKLGDPKSPRHRIVRSLDKCLPGPARHYLRETAASSPEGLRAFHSIRRVLYLGGYWQNAGYFDDAADLLRAELTPPEANPALEAELAGSPSVFLHIRRHRYSPRLDLDYYHRGISHFLDRVPDCRFEIFGDDLDWGRAHLDFRGRPARFHPGGPDDELRDLRLMSRCRHGIVANSSFSWWAAWLGPGERRICTPETPGWPVVPLDRWTKIPNRLE